MLDTSMLSNTLIHVPNRSAVTVGGNRALPVWGDCIKCSQLFACNGAFPFSRGCQNPGVHILLPSPHQPTTALPGRPDTVELQNRNLLLASLRLKVAFDRPIPLGDFRAFCVLWHTTKYQDSHTGFFVDILNPLVGPLAAYFTDVDHPFH